MKTVRWRGRALAFGVTFLLFCAAPVHAQVNIALGKPCIDESTRWNDRQQYDCQNVTDGNVCELDQNEGGPGVSSYWLGSEQSQFAQYVTIDLSAPTTITEIHLRNTHNAQYNDRATNNFQIEAGNVTGVGGTLLKPTVDIVDAVVILTGTLTIVDSIICPDEIPPDVFDSTNGLATGGKAFRYIRFVTIDSTHTNKNVGLNEIEIYGSQ
jgi:hypothetical protein